MWTSTTPTAAACGTRRSPIAEARDENTKNLPSPKGGSEKGESKHNIKFKGRNCQVHRDFPESFESSNRSRENLGRGIGLLSQRGDPSKTTLLSQLIYYNTNYVIVKSN